MSRRAEEPNPDGCVTIMTGKRSSSLSELVSRSCGSGPYSAGSA
jgi:hypothetical protein